jgi:hypothetical protein
MKDDHSPVSYEVMIVVRPDLIAAWEAYLPGHVLDVLASGCFKTGTIDRNEAGHYRCRYTAASRGSLDRYLADHAPALRSDALQRFPEGVEATRAVWTQWRVMAR